LGELDAWIDAGYLRNADDIEVRPVREVLARCISSLETIGDPGAADLARCAVLRSGQWALDMRSHIPSVEEVVDSLTTVSATMADAADEYAAAVHHADATYSLQKGRRRTVILEQRLPGLAERLDGKSPAPSLVLTSPPYPGVYVNYHRWKVRGRRETPAPYWLANLQDGNGLAYYTMSARSDRTQRRYFEQLEAAYSDVARLCDASTVVVQMVGFHDPAADLPRYLSAMEAAGFSEARLPDLATAPDGRLWRAVPNRRWWSVNSDSIQTAAEVVLVHVLRAGR
jgi:hypothetical protein